MQRKLPELACPILAVQRMLPGVSISQTARLAPFRYKGSTIRLTVDLEADL